MSWAIREYQQSDFEACIALIESNTPAFFAEDEPEELKNDLRYRASLPQHKQWPYFVICRGGQVIGSGGYCLDKKGDGVLLWGMIHRDEQHKNYGTKLLNYRINHIKGRVDKVVIDTTPESFGFYKKAGFIQTGFEKDGYEKGLDKILAALALND